mmetsp:Transcript_5709/g.8095  ORF Transcript_5709/g.8095 Transcript_5709/m.8095 type:complete len:97 (-) Transcript_5709:140-430(-)
MQNSVQNDSAMGKKHKHTRSPTVGKKNKNNAAVAGNSTQMPSISPNMGMVVETASIQSCCENQECTNNRRGTTCTADCLCDDDSCPGFTCNPSRRN